jgi:hypothetical protein
MSDTRFVWKHLPTLVPGMNVSQILSAIQAMDLIVSAYAAPHINGQLITVPEVLAIVKTLGMLSNLIFENPHLALVWAKFSYGSGNTEKSLIQLRMLERYHPDYWPAICYHAGLLFTLAKKADISWEKQEEYLKEAHALTQLVIRHDKTARPVYRPTAEMIEYVSKLQREIKELLVPADASPFKTNGSIKLFTSERPKPKERASVCVDSDRFDILFGKKSLIPVCLFFSIGKISCYKNGDVSVDPDLTKRIKLSPIGSERNCK